MLYMAGLAGFELLEVRCCLCCNVVVAWPLIYFAAIRNFTGLIQRAGTPFHETNRERERTRRNSSKETGLILRGLCGGCLCEMKPGAVSWRLTLVQQKLSRKL